VKPKIRVSQQEEDSMEVELEDFVEEELLKYKDELVKHCQ